MKALDLFCCAGGAGKGLAEAGLDVTGVDIADQPRYPLSFIRANALEVVFLALAWMRGRANAEQRCA